MAGALYSYSVKELGGAGNLADSVAAPSVQRPNEFTPTNPSVVNTVNVAIAPAAPTTSALNTTIQYAQAIADDSVANFGTQSTPVVVTLLETLDDAGDLASYLIQPVPKFWFGNIRIVMNGLTDAQRTTITNLDIGSQISVTKTFPKSTPSTVTQLMALEGISHEITPDRHIVTLYTNPARIYTYFIVGGYTTTITRTNLVLNPNIEVAPVGWNYSAGTVSIAQSSTYANTGLYSIAETFIAGGTSDINPGYISITANTTYNFSAYLRSTVSRSARVYIAWYNGTTFISNSVGSLSASSTSGFTRYTVSGTAPATATQCITNMQIVSGVLGDVHYWDSMLLEIGSSALPYFDGSYADTYTDYTLTSQTWNGTANASTSTATWGLTSSFVGSQLNDDAKGLG